MFAKNAEDGKFHRGENLGAERPSVTVAPFRIRWGPEAAWLGAVCSGTFRGTLGPGRRDGEAWGWKPQWLGSPGLWWHGASAAQSHRGGVDVSERGSLHPQATEALRHECLQVGACLGSREH